MKKLLALPLLVLSLSQTVHARVSNGGVIGSLRKAVMSEQLDQRIKFLEDALENAQAVPPELGGLLILQDLSALPSNPSAELVATLVTDDLLKNRARLGDAKMDLDEAERRLRSWPEGDQARLKRALELAKLRVELMEAKVEDREQDLKALAVMQAGQAEGRDLGVKERKIKLMEQELAFLQMQKKAVEGEPQP